MSMNNMTAVEWLYDWMVKNQYFIGNDLLIAFDKAKQKHKDEIIKAWSNGHQEENLAEKYYNKEFGANE